MGLRWEQTRQVPLWTVQPESLECPCCSFVFAVGICSLHQGVIDELLAELDYNVWVRAKPKCKFLHVRVGTGGR